MARTKRNPEESEQQKSVVKVQILEHVGMLSASKSGWTTELNLVSWDERPAKYDIRSWSPDRTRMGKGSTFTLDELRALYQILAKWDWDSINKAAPEDSGQE